MVRSTILTILLFTVAVRSTILNHVPLSAGETYDVSESNV